MLAFLSLLLKDLKRVFVDSGFQYPSPSVHRYVRGQVSFSGVTVAGVGPARGVAMDTSLLCLRHQFTSSSIGDEFKKTTLCVHG